jgi:transposase
MMSLEGFAACIGIDWAQEKHAVCILPTDGSPMQQSELKQDPEAIAEWVAGLRERFGGQAVAVCLELSRGALVYALMQYDFLVLYPINPKQLKDYRAALYPSGSKNDPNDCELAARFLRDHRDKLRAWKPDDEITRGLRLLTEQRREWVQDRVRRTNELRQRLRESYVVALELCRGDLWTEQFLELLEKFPSQRELQRAKPSQLQRWLPKVRRVADDPPAETLLQERIAKLRKATPMTTDRAVLAHSRLVVTNLVVLIQALNKSIAECDRKIAELFAQHPDAELFSSFPGAGNALAPRLAAAYGTDRGKFTDAQDMQQLSGIAPVTKSSGKSKVVLVRRACPKFLRQTFHEFALHSVKASRWAQAYVAMRRAHGHRYHTIIRSLAFKWQRIITHCWQAHAAYDEHRYLQRLRAVGAKLLEHLPPEPVPNA